VEGIGHQDVAALEVAVNDLLRRAGVEVVHARGKLDGPVYHPHRSYFKGFVLQCLREGSPVSKLHDNTEVGGIRAHAPERDDVPVAQLTIWYLLSVSWGGRGERKGGRAQKPEQLGLHQVGRADQFLHGNLLALPGAKKD